jgi:hypothetical protein
MSYAAASFEPPFSPIHERIHVRTRHIIYEEDMCDISGCAVVALRSFAGERRANF